MNDIDYIIVIYVSLHTHTHTMGVLYEYDIWLVYH